MLSCCDVSLITWTARRTHPPPRIATWQISPDRLALDDVQVPCSISSSDVTTFVAVTRRAAVIAPGQARNGRALFASIDVVKPNELYVRATKGKRVSCLVCEFIYWMVSHPRKVCPRFRRQKTLYASHHLVKGPFLTRALPNYTLSSILDFLNGA